MPVNYKCFKCQYCESRLFLFGEIVDNNYYYYCNKNKEIISNHIEVECELKGKLINKNEDNKF